jgi:aquaporin Z
MASVEEVWRKHWRLYLYEGVELALFMVSACLFTVVLFGEAGVVGAIPSAEVRRLLMGVTMGGTAVGIIHSPIGKKSGAHFNPAITLTYLWLGKITPSDALGYVVGQFVGGIAGVGVASLLLGSRLALPAVNYVVTVPGKGGFVGAFAAEVFMAALLMAVVLVTSNHRRLAAYTSYCVGTLIVGYVYFFGPVSGFSINPARTVGSAVFAGVWTGWWIYFVAPVVGMMSAAGVFAGWKGFDAVLCAKLHPAPSVLCPFDCRIEEHIAAN